MCAVVYVIGVNEGKSVLCSMRLCYREQINEAVV